MLVRRRRRRNRAPARAAGRQGTAAGLAGGGMTGREMAVVPGFGDDPAESGSGASTPAAREQAAEPQATGATGPSLDPDGPAAKRARQRAKPDGPVVEPAAPRAGRAAPRADPQANGAAGPAHDPDRPRADPDPPQASPNGRPATAGATVSDRIGSYYDEADRAMSDYLAAMGWTDEPETRPTG